MKTGQREVIRKDATPLRVPDPTVRPSSLRVIRALIAKDLKLELRTRESLPALVLFSLSAFILFHFALNRGSVEGDLAAGALWITLLFAAILAISRLFVTEREQGGFEAFLLTPAPRICFLISKVAVLLIFLSLFELVALPAFAAFLLGPALLPALPGLIAILVLSNLGIAIVGTLIGAIAVHSRTRELIVALIALPLLLPIVIAAAKASAPLLVGGGPEPLPLRWLGILALYDMVFALVTYAISDLLLDD